MNNSKSSKRKLLPPIGLLLSLLAELPFLLSRWPTHPAKSQVIVGTACLSLGAVLNLWAERLFKKAGTGVCPFSAMTTLVTNGPFRWTRNPMYLGMVLLAAGAAFVSGVTLNLLWAAAFAIWLHVSFILPEEAFMTGAAGVAYLQYAVRVPRWVGLPGPAISGAQLLPGEQPGLPNPGH